jgi:4-amino-4-deoxy-L-arabinose transferase-like glycosyltransferase
VLLGLALRVATIDVQGLWLDEIFTVNVTSGDDLGRVWSLIRQTENTPPLYYVLGWGWRQVVGSGDVDLRLLSALVGSLAVWPTALLARRVAGPRHGATAGLLAGLLLAVNPLAHWMGQEARTYALLLLVAGIAWLALVAALEDPTPGRLWRWALAAAALAWTHYFGLLVLGLGWLLVLRRMRGTGAPILPRAAVAPLALSGAAALALVPIALDQQSTGMYNGIASGGGLLERTLAAPKQFAVGYAAPVEDPLGFGVALLLAAVLLGGWRAARADGGAARRAALVGGLAAVVWLVPELAAIAGFDVVLSRNLLLLMPALWALVGIAAAAGPRWSRVGVGVVVAVQLGVIAWVAVTPGAQRDDWRGAFRAAAVGGGPQLLLVDRDQLLPVVHYVPGAWRLPTSSPEGRGFHSIAVIDRPAARGKDVPRVRPIPAPPVRGMRLVRAQERSDQWRIYVWAAPAAGATVPVTAQDVSSLRRAASKAAYVVP